MSISQEELIIRYLPRLHFVTTVPVPNLKE